MLQETPHKNRGTPRAPDTYRGWKRNNAVSWKGVKPTKREEHPPLVPKISERGEKHYVKLWD